MVVTDGLQVMNDSYLKVANYLGISVNTLLILFAIIGIWSLIWKGFALWRASKKNQLVWFIILLFVNTVGILEILYLFVFSNIKLENKRHIERDKKEKLSSEKLSKPKKK